MLPDYAEVRKKVKRDIGGYLLAIAFCFYLLYHTPPTSLGNILVACAGASAIVTCFIGIWCCLLRIQTAPEVPSFYTRRQ